MGTGKDTISVPSLFYEVYMTSEQAFEILGIKDRNIDEGELRRAFHEAARLTHPDSNPDDENAKNKFNMINEAYKVLSAYISYGKETYNGKKVYTYDWSTHTAKSDPKEHAWKQNQSSSWKQTDTDPWDRYAEADRQFAKERKRQAEAELRRQEKLKKLKREAEYQHRRYLKEEMLKEQQRKKEQDRLAQEEQKKEQERIIKQQEKLRQEKLKLESKRRLFELVETEYAPELFMGTVLTLAMIILSVMNVVSQGREARALLNYALVFFCATMIVIAACRITVYVRNRRQDKLISIISFLATLELGMAVCRILSSVFGANRILPSLVAVIVLWIYEFTRRSKAVMVLIDERRHLKYLIYGLFSELLLSTFLEIVIILTVIF